MGTFPKENNRIYVKAAKRQKPQKTQLQTKNEHPKMV